MNYDTLIETMREIVNNESIYKDGLTMTYSLDNETHKKVSEHFFYKIMGNSKEEYEYSEEFEVEIADILIKFVVNEQV